MEIEINNKKTKASTEMESLDGASQKKKVRAALTLVDEMDPVFKITKEELTASINKWFDDCDPSLRETCFGWGYYPMVAKEMHERRSATRTLSLYAEYYKDKAALLLENDKALCEGICPLHVFHIAAYEWSDRPNITYGSFEQQVLFFVMKHNLQQQKTTSMEKFVHRLLDLSYQIYRGDEYEKDGKDEQGKIVWKKKNMLAHITKIEPNQQAAVGIFFYPNLQFLYKRKAGDEKYALVCHEFKRGVDSFCESLQQLDERLSPPHYGSFEWSHMVAGQKALDHALEKMHQFLEYPESSFRELKFNEKPLSIVQVTAFCAKF